MMLIPHINSLSRDPGRDAYFASKNCNNLRRTDSFTSKRRTSLRYNGNTIVLRTALNIARAHESAVSDALGRGLPDIKGVPAPGIPIEPLHNYMDELADRISDLRGTVPSTAVEELQAELAELRARKLLADNLDQVLDIIERRKRIAA